MDELIYTLTVFGCGLLCGGLLSLSYYAEVKMLRRRLEVKDEVQKKSD